MASRTRGWCFTVNNFNDAQINTLNGLECRYLVYGQEVGESGTPHLQGYVEFEHPKTLGGLKKILPTAHWEQRKGTPEQASTYCKKDGQVTERGEIPRQGKRSDLEEVAKLALDRSVPLEQIAATAPAVYARYHRGLEKLKSTLYTERTSPPEVVWLYGPTGVGKTRQAVEANSSFFIKDGTRWWDGYTQQHTIIIDDFDGKWPIRDLLRLLDRYPYQGETKGGYVKINSPLIFITCDKPPECVWFGHELAQIMRRIN